MHLIDRISKRLGLSIRAKLAVTFIGTLALLSGLLVFVMPYVMERSMRSFVTASADAPTEQAVGRVSEDLGICQYLLRQRTEQLSAGLRVALGDRLVGEWVRQPDAHRHELQARLAKVRSQLGVSLLTMVGTNGNTLARGTAPQAFGDRFCPPSLLADPAAATVERALKTASAGRGVTGFFALPAAMLRNERDLRPSGGSRTPPAGNTLADRALVRALTPGSPASEDHGLTLLAVEPVRAAGGEVVAVLLGGDLLNNSTSMLGLDSTLALPQTATSLYRKSLCIASHSPRSNWGSRIGERHTPDLLRAALGKERGVVQHRLGEDWLLSAWVRLRDPAGQPLGTLWASRQYDLQLLYEGVAKLAAQAQRQSWRFMVFEVVLAGLLAFLLASLAATHIVEPIRRLRSGARKIGSGDLDHRLDVRTGDELEELARSFNEMAERLKEARQQDRLATVGRMASTIIHDLRNPLTLIRGFTPLLADLATPAAERKEFEQYMVAAADRIDDMVRDLLDYARGEGRALSLQTEPLGDFVAHLEPLLRQELSGTEIGLGLEVLRNPTVALDHRTMERVVLNLAGNARDAMEGRGKLALEADLEDGRAVLRVRDSGPGIPDEIRNRLFEPFATHGKEHGTGLGLAICKQFVGAHGGEVEVESQPGEGTTFTIRLPVAEGGEVR
jgi:signal transduction histidine kinase